MKKYLFVIFVLSIFILSSCISGTHTHTFSTTWSYDEDYHWHEATCEHKDEVSAESHHKYGEYVSDNNATTEVDGTKSRICKTCGYKNTVTEEGSKIHVHSWGEGVITTDPGCETAGIRTYICSCGETKTESISAAGHSFGEYVPNGDATTETDGTKTRFCMKCAFLETVIDEGSKIHIHSWNVMEIIAATCETDGTITYNCICGEIYVEYIYATGHSYSENWYYDDNYHWLITTCVHSGEIFCKTSHIYDEEHPTIIPPTEELCGSKIVKCICCSYEFKTEIPPLPHYHSFEADWTSNEAVHWHAAVCGHKDQIKDEAVHTWNNIQYKFDNTIGADIRICTICNYCDQKPHEHVQDTEVVIQPVSLSSDGIKGIKCSYCNTIVNTQIIPKPFFYDYPIDVTTGTVATNSSQYVYFGVYPQSVYDNYKYSIDEEFYIILGDNKYYYCSDGYWYIYCVENAYENGYTYSNGITVKQKPEDSSLFIRKSYKYFKVEPIKWKVLTTNYNGTEKALLLAENILTAYYFYSYISQTYARKIGDKSDIYANNYQYSQIRAYLNGLEFYAENRSLSKTEKTDYFCGKGFLQTAFTPSAQELISETMVDNSSQSACPENGGFNFSLKQYSCENTLDKIFLLSECEVTSNIYGFGDHDDNGLESNRIRLPTDYAKANYTFQSLVSDNGGKWWLRSPYNNFYPSYVLAIQEDGSANTGANETNCRYYGIVPALTICFQNIPNLINEQ